LKFKKAEEDLARVVAGPNGVPTKFTLITGGKASADMRDRVIARAKKLGVRVGRSRGPRPEVPARE
jgi:hypothetical protein